MRRFASLFILMHFVASPVWAEDHPARLRVFASVLPVQTFIEAVGGERVETEVMVLPGQSPATYDPSPKQVAALAGADLYVRVGVPFELAWMKRIQAANPDMPVLDLRDGLPLRLQEAHEHDHEHGQHVGHAHEATTDTPSTAPVPDEMDPHIWTSPLLVREMAVAIRTALSELDPEGAPLYARRQQDFDAELLALHQDLQRSLAGLDDRAFLVYHPAWGYFADTYDLEQIPIERAGKQPGPRRLSALIEQAQTAGTRAIFVQPEFDQRIAEQVARSIGGRVEVATPLAANYAENLQRFAAILVDANSRSDSTDSADSTESAHSVESAPSAPPANPAAPSAKAQ
ncbi:MAG: zinc ABC transporter substrate-binding protein [Lamprobacter sp.]|uniref:metal ABC transporter solute-binding protein, Zn/Mn family n=1 Tax=Lamprobacter sp. TaxID=3100796 RepID=UPI002B25D56A|nr:zinc ABC transporter substrate-binding protein [Lamprobacter sp.]MEA3640395.1 zinc ABC transporter substrate-binding protein [Lamprobacter sp.]